MVLIFYWMIFKEAGQRGWYSLVPIFSTYALFSMAWDSAFFWLYSLCIGSMIAATCAAMPFGMILGYALGMVVYLIMLIKLYNKLPGGRVWVVLVIIFDVIFNCISFYFTMVNMYATGFFSQGA